MVKLNFKKSSPIDIFSEMEKDTGLGEDFFEEKSPAAPDKKKKDSGEKESFFAESEFEGKKRATEPKGFEPEQKKEPAPTEEYDYTIPEEGVELGEPSSSGKKLYIIFGVVAVLLIVVIYFVYQYIQKRPEEVAVKPKPANSETIPPKTQPNQPVESSMMNIYQQNLGANRFLVGQLQALFSKKPGSANYSLIILSPPEVTLTVLGNSRDDIAGFNMDLKNAFPSLGFQIVNIQPRYGEQGNLVYADIVGKISENPGAAQEDVSPISAIGNLKDEMAGLSKKSGVTLQYFKQGQTRSNRFKTTSEYMNLIGKRDNVVNFLKKAVQTYPMIRINKLSIFPNDTEIITNQNISARVNFTYYSE